MTLLSEDEKTIVYSVLAMEHGISVEEAYPFVENYEMDEDKILRVVSKDIADQFNSQEAVF